MKRKSRIKRKGRIERKTSLTVKLLCWILGWSIKPVVPTEWKMEFEITHELSVTRTGKSVGTIVDKFRTSSPTLSVKTLECAYWMEGGGAQECY